MCIVLHDDVNVYYRHVLRGRIFLLVEGEGHETRSTRRKMQINVYIIYIIYNMAENADN